MKLIRCYVENFGKISKYTYDFNEGLNIIEEENGWGKSTFAAFIKAMFYGLDYKMGKTITDRKRFMPWNGNKFGGYIILEKDGINYKIERFFGKKDKEDTFTLYNLSKNTVSEDLSENLGEDIWKVDRDSYEKTAFITLNDSSLLNDIISSKLGNIEDQESDLETSTKAVDILENEMQKIKAKRLNGGLLGLKTEKINSLKQEMRQCKSSLAKIGEIENWIKIEKVNLDIKTLEMDKLDEEQSKIILYEKKQQYENILADYTNKKNVVEENEKFFKGNYLTESELNNLNEEVNNYLNQKQQSEKNELSQIEKSEFEELSSKFREGIPKQFQIEECNEKIMGLSNKRTELKNCSMTYEEKSKHTYLNNKYNTLNLTTDTINNYLNDFNQVTILEKEENNISLELSKLEGVQDNTVKNGSKNKMLPLLFIGIGIFMLGILLISQSLLVGYGISGLGVIIGVISLLLKPKANAEHQLIQENEHKKTLEKRWKEIEVEKKVLESGYLSFLKSINESSSNIASSLANIKVELGEYKRLNDKESIVLGSMKKLESEIAINIEEIEFFLGKYCNVLLVTDYENTLSDLRKGISRFEKLSNTNELCENAKKIMANSKDILAINFMRYYEEMPIDMVDAMNELRRKYYDLDAAKKQLKESSENKSKYELENNVEILEQLVLPDMQNNQLAENLLRDKRNLDQLKTNIIRTIERYNKDINDLGLEADRIEDIEFSITQLEIEIEELEKQYKLLNLTKECMIEAKENLASKYMGDMSLKFEKYLKELNNDKTDTYQIDINLDVKVEHEGELHESNELSSGMKDLIQVCMRMALVEAVYKDVEKPILVLDDPFVNLDNGRIQNATKLLKKIGLEYQTIYFICHNSRSVM